MRLTVDAEALGLADGELLLEVEDEQPAATNVTATAVAATNASRVDWVCRDMVGSPLSWG